MLFGVVRRSHVFLCVWYVVAFINLCVVASLQPLSIERVTACTGRCSYTYSMTCPLGSKIAPRELKYYGKPTSTTCPAESRMACQNKKQCCSYSPGDCSIRFSMDQAFEVFSNCSALQQCGVFRAKSISTRSHCSLRTTTNYVAATFSCVNDSSFIDICSNDTLRGSSINLLYNGSRMSHYSSRATNCKCAVSTSDCESPARLRFRGVDIRLQQSQNIKECHPHSRFTITDTGGSRNFFCERDHFYRGYDDIYFSYSPYARVSLQNQPGLFPSQLWLSVEATMPGVDVVVTCGRLRPESQSFCGPPDILTTPHLSPDPPSTPDEADIFAKPDKNEGNPASDDSSDDASNPINNIIKSDYTSVIAGSAGGLLLIVILVILLICIKRRKRESRKPKMLPHPVPLSEPSSPLHSYPTSEQEDKYGNYYETMATDIPNGNTESPPFTPGKNMGSFFPSERRISRPIVCSPPVPPPVTVPLAAQSRDINPYHAPWDASILQGPNRTKRNDLAYATSEEIQVLIQRMETDRRNLNEGPIASPPPSYSYIHIDDYKIPADKRQTKSMSIAEEKEELYVYENDSDSEDEDEEEHNGDADNESEDNNDEDIVRRVAGSQGTNDGTPRSNDNFCGSEDTGYRSVGSPDQVLVCEDDYLVPGSVKSAVSSNSKASTVRVGDRGSMASSAYGEVYDALKEGEMEEIKTKL